MSRTALKAGIPHLEAPPWLLAMLTVRMALDDVGADNRLFW